MTSIVEKSLLTNYVIQKEGKKVVSSFVVTPRVDLLFIELSAILDAQLFPNFLRPNS
jgi:hypothetical protein